MSSSTSRYFASDGTKARRLHEMASALIPTFLRVSLPKCLVSTLIVRARKSEALLDRCVPSLKWAGRTVGEVIRSGPTCTLGAET